MTTAELVDLARREYGDLIDGISAFPDGGITVGLIGGGAISYAHDGDKATTFEISWLRMRLWQLRGHLHRHRSTHRHSRRPDAAARPSPGQR